MHSASTLPPVPYITLFIGTTRAVEANLKGVGKFASTPTSCSTSI